MKLTRIDLNSWIFTVAGQTILVDPWLVDPMVFYGLPWLFTAYHNTPPIFTPETLPSIDLILLSQGLDDHCHKPTLGRLDRAIPVIASPTAAKVVTALGYQQVTVLTAWQAAMVGTLQITAVPGAEIQPGQVENGYWLRDCSTGASLYYEPHLAPEAQVLKQRLGQVDVAIAPIIGQIFPVLGQVIMGAEQSLQLAQTLHPRFFVPTTMGDIRTQGILPRLIKSVGSVAEFRDRLSSTGLVTTLLLPEPGETVEIPATAT
ncbi:MBL fold metallo-hydrolase [Pantanalinema sp. GBBB05]|uniref:MBL fold metallo-hydrolase n=1 Tax=Pantanalinema sp. GBBB05 TaxID=2604139 RepID=UPI001D879CA9|nr:MBL fold metallo-hydrolase [Pantanalinema sp. GBBB05]